jgi:Mg/Co/Ni transporter MgtE
MASYEQMLRANILVAFFIPALVHIMDAMGTQTEAIAVRGLSLRHRPLMYILGSEIMTGALTGLALGVLVSRIMARGLSASNIVEDHDAKRPHDAIMLLE